MTMGNGGRLPGAVGSAMLLLALLLLAACDNPAPAPYVKRPPASYLVTGTVLLSTAKEVPPWCSPAAIACTPMDKSRRIYTLDPCDHPGEKYAEGLCHEYAHAIGGWPNNHPD